ncbi:DUF2384 domain-containing protein [Pseudomonas vanderleydeniana]|uniref:DUF2384 domain-containing protein n=2 Tax=Pseudomonas vanderleydeniana TaxID=2745495 RepID=A0A9E6PRH1_9PSED|nr:DUF2384 domain-containing protein [Pseudomonas vanderleydeniana]
MNIEVVDGVAELRVLASVPACSWSLGVALREETHRAYRQALEAYLQIPVAASEHAIHSLIEAGFSIACMHALCERGIILPAEQEGVISGKTLLVRGKENPSLSPDESDRLFRIVHIIAMSEAIFGDHEKARRWLSKPKTQLNGRSPRELLWSCPGAYQIEQMLIRLAEGLYS